MIIPMIKVKNNKEIHKDNVTVKRYPNYNFNSKYFVSKLEASELLQEINNRQKVLSNSSVLVKCIPHNFYKSKIKELCDNFISIQSPFHKKKGSCLFRFADKTEAIKAVKKLKRIKINKQNLIAEIYKGDFQVEKVENINCYRIILSAFKKHNIVKEIKKVFPQNVIIKEIDGASFILFFKDINQAIELFKQKTLLIDGLELISNFAFSVNVVYDFVQIKENHQVECVVEDIVAEIKIEKSVNKLISCIDYSNIKLDYTEALENKNPEILNYIQKSIIEKVKTPQNDILMKRKAYEKLKNVDEIKSDTEEIKRIKVEIILNKLEETNVNDVIIHNSEEAVFDADTQDKAKSIKVEVINNKTEETVFGADTQDKDEAKSIKVEMIVNKTEETNGHFETLMRANDVNHIKIENLAAEDTSTIILNRKLCKEVMMRYYDCFKDQESYACPGSKCGLEMTFENFYLHHQQHLDQFDVINPKAKIIKKRLQSHPSEISPSYEEENPTEMVLRLIHEHEIVFTTSQLFSILSPAQKVSITFPAIQTKRQNLNMPSTSAPSSTLPANNYLQPIKITSKCPREEYLKRFK